ncbi:MAG TPA: metalloregulator ArsR/SmtB family transcription factor [Thermoanaerobaculia bacterium]|jgi:DNA-binding transcriptional ArsR family regulator|nr:metalloregulator ArsR/SmtB family transcription factor [Thermoanaerobaculia bacterium]
MVTNYVFRAVADPTRRKILARLRAAPLETGRIARMFPVSRPAISKHLRVLAEAGLVRRRRQGRRCLYTLNAAPLKAVEEWVSLYRDFWSGGARSGHPKLP